MKEKKVALITGVTGQDGSYLAEFLLKKATRCMALSAARRLISASVSRIWRESPISRGIMPTSANKGAFSESAARFDRKKSTTSPRRVMCR